MALLLYFGNLISSGRFFRPDMTTVMPDNQQTVRIDLSDLPNQDVRFYRFINSGNQEVEFLVGRDEHGTVHVAFNASENHYKLRRGFKFQDGWIVDKKCETSSRLSNVNQSNGLCKPVILEHRLVGDELILTEGQILQGWRYFR